MCNLVSFLCSEYCVFGPHIDLEGRSWEGRSAVNYQGRYAQHIAQKRRYSLCAVKAGLLVLSDDPEGNGGCQQEIAEMR